MGRVSNLHKRARTSYHFPSYWSELDGDGTLVWGREYLCMLTDIFLNHGSS